MRFRLTPRSMTLDDLEFYKFEFSENFLGFRRFRTQQAPAKRMKIDQYCQRQRLACIRVAQVFQRQLGFLVLGATNLEAVSVLHLYNSCALVRRPHQLTHSTPSFSTPACQRPSFERLISVSASHVSRLIYNPVTRQDF